MHLQYLYKRTELPALFKIKTVHDAPGLCAAGHRKNPQNKILPHKQKKSFYGDNRACRQAGGA